MEPLPPFEKVIGGSFYVGLFMLQDFFRSTIFSASFAQELRELRSLAGGASGEASTDSRRFGAAEAQSEQRGGRS